MRRVDKAREEGRRAAEEAIRQGVLDVVETFDALEGATTYDIEAARYALGGALTREEIEAVCEGYRETLRQALSA